MSKVATLYVFTLALLLSVSLIYASSPNLAFEGVSSLNEGVVADAAPREELDDEKCEGVEGIGMEDCLKRRTLTAHTDYIYTGGP